jgi:hypothetical protein
MTEKRSKRAKKPVTQSHSRARICAGVKRCGARTRKGTPCQARGVPRNGRCCWHGGFSTGPRTAEGKARVTKNLPGHAQPPIPTTKATETV